MKITRLEALPIILNPCGQEDGPQQLVDLEVRADEEAERSLSLLRVEVSIEGRRVEQPLSWPRKTEKRQTFLKVPYTGQHVEATVSIHGDSRVLCQEKITLEPVPPFQFYLMPSSHLCFGYEPGSPLEDHLDSARIVRDAINFLEANPEATWIIEFMYGLKNLLDKYPDYKDRAAKLLREERLYAGGWWMPTYAYPFDEESLVRQVAVAQWWIKENFGLPAPVVVDWDVCTHLLQKPQISIKSRIKGLLNGQYLGRSRTKLGDGVCRWRGPEGSELTTFSPTIDFHGDNYYSISSSVAKLLKLENFESLDAASIREVADLIRRAGERAKVDCLAGTIDTTDQSHPNPRTPERAERWNHIFKNPRIGFTTPARFLERRLRGDAPLQEAPSGEKVSWFRILTPALELIFKVVNTACNELKLAEKSAALDAVMNGTIFPQELLETLWANVLWAEQHEAVGSGPTIADDAHRYHEGLARQAIVGAREVTRGALSNMASRIQFQDGGTPLVVFNLLNWDRRDVVTVLLPSSIPQQIVLLDSDEKPVPCEVEAVNQGVKMSFIADVPSMGYATYYVSEGRQEHAASSAFITTKSSIENEYYKVVVDRATGVLTSIIDKELQRELIDTSEGHGGNELVLLEDLGWEDWGGQNLTGVIWRERDFPPSSISISRDRLSARINMRGPFFDDGSNFFGKYWEQEVTLYTGIKRLDFKVRFDWEGKRRVQLRWRLPLAVKEPNFTYDTQYGVLDYDPAEVDYEESADQPEWVRADTILNCRTMRRWLSAYDHVNDFGVTVSTPSTLVFLDGSIVDWNIISHREVPASYTFPRFKGEHTFQYSLTSHRGDWRQANSPRFGWEHKDNAMRVILAESRNPKFHERRSLLQVGPDNVILAVLKTSHRGNDVVARCYETKRKKGSMKFSLNLPGRISDAWESSMLEEPEKAVSPQQLAVGIPIRSSEIKTLRLRIDVDRLPLSMKAHYHQTPVEPWTTE